MNLATPVSASGGWRPDMVMKATKKFIPVPEEQEDRHRHQSRPGQREASRARRPELTGAVEQRGLVQARRERFEETGEDEDGEREAEREVDQEQPGRELSRFIP